MNAPVAEWMKPIVAVPLQQAFPQLGEVKEFRSKVCLFNHDRTKLFDVVSPRYQVIEHRDAFNLINEGLQEYFDAPIKSAVRSLDGGVRLRTEFKLPIPAIKVARGDITEITMVMQNSYDRSMVFSAELGAFRLICSNGMKIGQSFGSIKARHIIGAEGNADLLTNLSTMISRAPQLRDMWMEWREIKVDFEEAIGMVDGQFPEKYLGPILVEDRFPRTKWEFYNDLTRFSTHDVTSVRRRMEFDDLIARIFYDGAEVEDAEIVE